MWLRCALTLSLMLISHAALAADFYVDPKTGDDGNPGTQAQPWKSLQAVIDGKKVQTQGWPSLPYKAGMKLVAKNAGGVVKAGDTIWLRSGYYGAINISSHYNKAAITIAAAPGQTPELKSLLVRASGNWILKGLHVSPSFAPKYEKKNAVVIQSHAHQGPVRDITLEGCQIFSVKDIKPWSASDWNGKAVNGIQVSGSRITIKNNTVKNINFGISVTATDSMIEGNTVENFAGDGLRGLGDNCVFQYNVVKNCYKVNSNHDDGFQSWSVGSDGKVGTGVVKNVTLRGNTIINYTDAKQPMRCTLQGIGMFDGTFDGWVIENNVIIVDHWHGISLLGVKNSRVVNNTLMDPNNERPGPPWIKMDKHKNGTPPSGCLVRNNLTPDISNAKTGVKADNNIQYKDAKSFFVDPAAYDLHLLPSSAAIDKGSSDMAPKLDRDKAPRPFGAAIDIGAYEWRDTPIPPSEPAPPDAGPADNGGPLPDAPTQDKGTPPPDNPQPQPDSAQPQPDTTQPQPDTAVGVDAPQADNSGGQDSGSADSNPTPPKQGCGCTTGPHAPFGWLLLLLLIGLVVKRPSSRHAHLNR